MGLLRGKIVLGEEDLQCAAGADRADDPDRRAPIRRHPDLGIGRREFGVVRGDAEIGDEGRPMPAPAAEPCTLDSEIFGMRRMISMKE